MSDPPPCRRLSRRSEKALAALAATAMLTVSAPAAAAGDSLPDGLEVRFGEEVDAQTRWYVDTAVEEAWGYFAPLLDAPEEFAAKVIVVTTADDAASEWAAERGISESRARRLFTARSRSYAGLATTGLTVIINNNLGGPGATLHEFVHLFQHEIAGRSQGPRWISEGAAQYFDMLIDHAWGIDTEAASPGAANRQVADEWAATARNCWAGLLPGDGETCQWALASLASLESAGPFDIGDGAVSAYSRAAVGFQRLMDETGVDHYMCFLTSQGNGTSWRSAFSDCFEMTVDEYYRLFDHSRDRGFIRQVASRISELR